MTIRDEAYTGEKKMFYLLVNKAPFRKKLTIRNQ